MKKILVTGGTGTWGKEIVKQLLDKKTTKRIVVYSRAERSQEAMKRMFRDSRVEYVLGDVCNYQRLLDSMEDIDTVIHTAAIKAIPNMEKDAMHGYEINITGTYNTIRAAIKNSVKNFIFVSTDKAVNPINAYGVSKAAAEHTVKQAAINNPKMNIRIVRSGNVIGSSSSVLHVWKESLTKTNSIKITVPQMTRFYIRIEDAVKGLFDSLERKEVVQANLSKNATLDLLARASIKLWGNSKTKVEYIGNRGNEKIHEQMLSIFDGYNKEVYSCDTQSYELEELMELIVNEKI